MSSWIEAELAAAGDAALAEALQRRLAHLVRETPLPGEVALVVGFDAAYDAPPGGVRAAAVVWDVTRRSVVDRAVATLDLARAYRPALLAWRELPALLAAFRGLTVRPNLVLCDGHGRAHPRRCGLACMLGLALDLPTTGCAKDVLVGHFEAPAAERGDTAPLLEGEEIVGAAVRTRAGVRPVLVSVGHRVTLDDACREVLRVCRYRLPEPLRLAHALAAGRIAPG